VVDVHTVQVTVGNVAAVVDLSGSAVFPGSEQDRVHVEGVAEIGEGSEPDRVVAVGWVEQHSD